MNRSHLNPTQVLAQLALQRSARPELDTPFTPPSDATERAIADCWAEVLGVHEVGTHDNFFSLGGDSLHMTQIASRVRARCGVELPMGQFFTDPTVAGLAKIVQAMLDRESKSNGVPAAGATVAVTTAPPRFNLTAPAPARSAASSPRSSRKDDNAVRINSIVIPTAGRPGALARCLNGLGQNLRHYDRSSRILVIDGSTDAKTIAANRQAIESARRAHSLAIALVDGEATRAYAARLSDAGFDPELISFALPGTDDFRAGSRLGASRNLHLLATAGEAILSVDDDTDCLFATAPGFSPDDHTIGIDPAGDDPAQVWVYPDRANVLSTLRFTATDLIGSHEALLGLDVATLPGRTAHGPGNALDRVRVTLGGLAGDCGWGTPSRYLFIDEPSFRRLVRSDAAYRADTTSRDMLRVAPSALISGRVENLIAATFGADGRKLLPPFVPVGRGSDVVFGRLLKAFEPKTAFGHVPWAILHEPIEQRRFSPGEILRSSSTTDLRAMFCSLLTDGAADWNRAAVDPYDEAGEKLMEIAVQSLPDFQATLVLRRRAQVIAEIEFLDRRLDTLPPEAATCRRDITAYVAALRRSQDQVTASIPAELLYGRDLPVAAHLARKIVMLFGRLLCSWRDLATEAERQTRAGKGAFDPP